MAKKLFLILPLAAIFVLGGCVKDDESVPPSDNPYAGFKAEYAPAGALLPYPNDLYFANSTDGTVNIPVPDPTDTSDPNVAVNALDGFSTTAPASASFTDSIDDSTLVGGSTVFVFDVTNPSAPTMLTAGTDYTVGLSTAVDDAQRTVVITPLHPLMPQERYAVFLTDGIKSVTGDAASASSAFSQIKDAVANNKTLSDATLEATKEAVAPLLQLADVALQPVGGADSVVVAWSYTTQSIGASLDAIGSAATAQPAAVAFTTLTTKDVLDPTGTNPAVTGNANVYAGFVTVPYYLDASKPLTGYWQTAGGGFTTALSPMPEATAMVKVPVIITVPNGSSMPAGGWPVAIFQHGITRNRTDVFAVAEALANAGFAAVSIDLPLHGITDTNNSFYDNKLFEKTAPSLMVGERTFDLDVQNNTTGEAGADGNIDGSGSHFINLTSLLTSRDNLRESAADLISLTKTVPTIDIDGNTSNTDFNSANMRFVGHSLGAITGTVFLAENTDVKAATLGMPGGVISQLLQDSPAFAPQINAGLQAQGIVQGTKLYQGFFRNAQTVVDSGDPINYGTKAATLHPIHMIEVVGGSGSAADQVVPNSATDRLWMVMGLTPVSSTTTGSQIDAVVRFTAGDHGSLLDPSANPSATVEMQTEMANFAGSNGTYLPITDTSVVQ